MLQNVVLQMSLYSPHWALNCTDRIKIQDGEIAVYIAETCYFITKDSEF